MTIDEHAHDDELTKDEQDPRVKFEEALERLASRDPLGDEHYAQLSNVAGSRLDEFRRRWETLSVDERLNLLRRLRGREEDDLRLDFNPVYHLAIEDQAAPLRLAGIQSTIEDKSDWLFDRLMRLADTDPDTEVRAAAARALGPFAGGVELGEWPEEEADELEALLLRLVRRDVEPLAVRGAALEAAGHLNRADVAAEIDWAFREDGLRLDAIRAMGHSGEPRWLSRLLGAAEDPDPEVRKAVAKASGEIPDYASVPALVDMLDDESVDVRLAAIAALGELGGDEAREGLFYAIEDKRPEVREAASLALAELDFYDDPLSL